MPQLASGISAWSPSWTMADFIDVSGLLYPKSIAVIGASGRAGNLGGDTVQHLVRFGFPGKVWVVNPDGRSVQGVPCFPRIADLPEAPDLVILAIPADAVAETIRACAAHGTRHGVAFAGGFTEFGGEGVALQNELGIVCRDVGFTLCGPNCVGIINAATPVTATFATALSEFDTLRAGPISMVTQSGGIGSTIFSMVQRAGFGFRHLISSGNEAVVHFADYLYALARDDGTRIIAAYLEAIGDAARLVRALEAARDQGKKIVLIKAGARTGTMVGEDRVFDAILQEFGVIRVRSVEELVDVCLMLAGTEAAKLPRGRGVGIVTFDGGDGVLAADQCAAHGLTVPKLASASVKRLRPRLVSAAANPMVLTPTAALRSESLARLPAAMDALAAQPDIDSLLVIVGSLAAPVAEIGDTITEFFRRCAKPVCVSWPSPPAGAVERLAAAGIVAFGEPDRGLRALGRLAAHGEALARPRRAAAVAMPFVWQSHVEPGATVVHRGSLPRDPDRRRPAGGAWATRDRRRGCAADRTRDRIPGGIEGDQLESDASRGRWIAGDRPAQRRGSACELPSPGGQGARERHRARRHSMCRRCSVAAWNCWYRCSAIRCSAPWYPAAAAEIWPS